MEYPYRCQTCGARILYATPMARPVPERLAPLAHHRPQTTEACPAPQLRRTYEAPRVNYGARGAAAGQTAFDEFRFRHLDD